MRKLSSFRLWLYFLATRWLPETRCFAIKAAFLRWCGASVGRNVRINSSARFLGNGRLVLGDDVWVGVENLIYASGDAVIDIGAHCDLAPQVTILTGSHAIDPSGPHIAGAGRSMSITIGPGSWLGVRSTILMGVALAPRTVVAAGAVVTRSFAEEGHLLAGVPAVEKKRLI